MLKKLSILVFSLILVACAGDPPDINLPPTQPAPEFIPKHPTVALVLGGGGARGIAHAGVIKVLHDNHIPIDFIVGTSAGSIIGALYADNADPDQLDKLIQQLSLGDVLDFNNYPESQGILRGYRLQKFLMANMTHQTFDTLKIPLIVITTDLTTGKTYPIMGGLVAPAVQASAAIPGLFDPAHLYGHVLVDGGISDPIATDIAKTYHPDIIIAVNIAEELSPTMPRTAEEISNRAYLISRLAMSDLLLQDADIVIRPDVGQAGIFAVDQKSVLLNAGKKAAEKSLPLIQKKLKELKKS
jgi:NTE family protein